MDTKSSIFTSGGSHEGKIQVLVFMNEIKFDLTLKKIKFSVSFMLLFAIIKLLPTLRLSSENLTFFFFFFCHFASI